MSNLARRIDALTKRLADDRATVFLFSWLGDEPIATAICGEHTLQRATDESEVEFTDRATVWAKDLPGYPQGSYVWFER